MLAKKNVSKHQGLKFEAFKNGVTLRGLRSNVILKKDRNNNKKFTIRYFIKKQLNQNILHIYIYLYLYFVICQYSTCCVNES